MSRKKKPSKTRPLTEDMAELPEDATPGEAVAERPDPAVAPVAGSGHPTSSEPAAKSMFSAATFFDVISAGVPDPNVPLGEPTEAVPRPAVIAFYGFRGGAGRTLSLAHVAALLARQGARILLMDLDVEAPGLPVVLNVDVPDDCTGAVRLLRQAVTSDKTPLQSTKHFLAVQLKDALGRLLLLPAGKVDVRYLAEVEELSVSLWHLQEPSSPLRTLIADIRQSGEVDAIFIDCRTGFSGLSASVLFHEADLVVTFVPLSEQVWDGLDVLLAALRAAKSRRMNRPRVVFVPSMVPAGEVGRRRLAQFLSQLESRYVERIGPLQTEEDAEDPDVPVEPWVREGIRYLPDIAVTGRLDQSLASTVWPAFRPLADVIATYMAIDAGPPVSADFDTRRVLDEVCIDQELAFAEYPDFSDLVRQFVAPGNIRNVLDPATAVVVGAKGAGKTWLWRYLVNKGQGNAVSLAEGMTFVIGHGPSSPETQKLPLLSPNGFMELESQAQMGRRGSHRAFWCLYALRALVDHVEGLAEALRASARKDERRHLESVLKASDERTLLRALASALTRPDVGTWADALLTHTDRFLVDSDGRVTLVYDGLDTGFEVPGNRRWIDRRDRFVSSLLQLVAEARGLRRRLHFKVFLREDIYLSLSIQNKSHLEAVKAELRWRPEDLWRIALNIAATSATYTKHVISKAGVSPPWPVDEDTLKSLLAPFWGETIERRKTAKTANYVQKRTSDAADRLFPRTLVQLLDEAVKREKKAAPIPEHQRVIRFASLRDGVARASAQRVEDLKKEYVELAPYLEALRGMDITGTSKDFVSHMSRALRRSSRKGLLHSVDGWDKVIEQLKAVGVLGPYRRSSSDQGEQKLAIALLYRAGLGVRAAGIM